MVGVPDGVVHQHDYDFWVARFGNVLGAGRRTVSGMSKSATRRSWMTSGVITGARELDEVDRNHRCPLRDP